MVDFNLDVLSITSVVYLATLGLCGLILNTLALQKAQKVSWNNLAEINEPYKDKCNFYKTTTIF